MTEAAEQNDKTPEAVDEAQIDHMVHRFLAWKLPENFNPDGGISFKKMFNEHTAHPMKAEPSGTNLLDWTQAQAMVRHMIDGLPGCVEIERLLANSKRDAALLARYHEWCRKNGCEPSTSDLYSAQNVAPTVPESFVLTQEFCESVTDVANRGFTKERLDRLWVSIHASATPS